jgi:hypothetical protein
MPGDRIADSAFSIISIGSAAENKLDEKTTIMSSERKKPEDRDEIIKRSFD